MAGMLSKAKEATAEPENDDDTEEAAPKGESFEKAPPAEHAEPDGDEEAAGPGDEDGDEGGEDMPAALQPEYKRCVAALYEVLYSNDQTSRNVLDSLDPSPETKIESVARTAMILMQQLDERLNMQGDVIPYVLLTVVDRLVELLERAKQATFSEQELMATAAAAFEGAQNLFPTEQTSNATPEPGAVPPGAAEPAPEPAEAPEAEPTEEEVA